MLQFGQHLPGLTQTVWPFATQVGHFFAGTFRIVSCECHFHPSDSLAVIKLWNKEAIGSPEPDRISGIDMSSMPDSSTESKRQKSEGMIKALVMGIKEVGTEQKSELGFACR